jgi:tripartite-type tricarboxylate transporter receptor subunit TctC
MVPAGTPRPIVEQINKWFVQIVSSDDAKKFLNSFGGDPNIQPIDEAQATFLKDITSWGEYVRMAKIKPLG